MWSSLHANATKQMPLQLSIEVFGQTVKRFTSQLVENCLATALQQIPDRKDDVFLFLGLCLVWCCVCIFRCMHVWYTYIYIFIYLYIGHIHIYIGDKIWCRENTMISNCITRALGVKGWLALYYVRITWEIYYVCQYDSTSNLYIPKNSWGTDIFVFCVSKKKYAFSPETCCEDFGRRTENHSR